MTTNTIIAGDGTNAVKLTGGNDGTFSLQTGPSGGKINTIVFDTTGLATLYAFPKYNGYSSLYSTLTLSGSNGYGLTATHISRFTAPVTATNIGVDFTYLDDPVNGGSLTVSNAGLYNIQYSDAFSGNEIAAIVLNDVSPTTGLTWSTVLASATSDATGGYIALCSWTGYLSAGSVIKAKSNGTTAHYTTSFNAQFSMTRIG